MKRTLSIALILCSIISITAASCFAQAGAASGIGTAVWGEYTYNHSGDPGKPPHCSVLRFRGADDITGTPLNEDECRLTLTLPAGQPQSWGTAYACSAFIVDGSRTPSDTACSYRTGIDSALKPELIYRCSNPGGQTPVFAEINFLCIAP